MRKLRLLMDEERRQLERDVAAKLDQLDAMKKRHQVCKLGCFVSGIFKCYICETVYTNLICPSQRGFKNFYLRV